MRKSDDGISRRNLLIGASVSALSAAVPQIVSAEASVAKGTGLTLRSTAMEVEFHPSLPFPATYRHKASGLTFSGPDDRPLTIDGKEVPWTDWDVSLDSSSQPRVIVYHLYHRRLECALTLTYELDTWELSLRLAVVADPKSAVRSIGFNQTSLIQGKATNGRVWREIWKQKPWDSQYGRGLWSPTLQDSLCSKVNPDQSGLPTSYCCVTLPKKLAVGVLSNQRYLPFTSRIAGDEFHIGLSDYTFRARKLCLPPLEVRIAFLPDTNGDGTADASDYQLWVNRKFPQPWPNHRGRIWNKIYCGDRGQAVTTFAQAEQIIERIHRFTDGLPQVMYLVGWQYEGHDSGYPSIDKVNPHLGTREELWNLHRRAKEELNTVVSYHINLDDSYPQHPGWDESVICRDRDGKLMTWEPFSDGMSYHINHTKDVQSGKVFQKLEAMMREVPVEGALHVDAFRNMNWSWEPDGFIGPVEELECGIKPILEYLKQRGVDVTIESIDSGGTEWCGLISGILHIGGPRDLVQLRHGKMIYGGRSYPPNLWEWGLGSALNYDTIWLRDGKDFDASGAWHELLDGIYLGALLYHYYLEREMTVAHLDAKGAYLRFSDGTETTVHRDNSHLLVKRDKLVIADNFDRFIPRGDSIYAYSRDGSTRSWPLPSAFANRKLSIKRLGLDGSATVTVDVGTMLDLKLDPRVPVRITIV